jgi:hypothetical protein
LAYCCNFGAANNPPPINNMMSKDMISRYGRDKCTRLRCIEAFLLLISEIRVKNSQHSLSLPKLALNLSRRGKLETLYPGIYIN